jgi:hypothetical protein
MFGVHHGANGKTTARYHCATPLAQFLCLAREFDLAHGAYPSQEKLAALEVAPLLPPDFEWIALNVLFFL